MSEITAIIIFVVFFALMVILSGKLKINIGILGFLASFILAGWIGGASPATIVSYIPTSTLFTLFIASAFFCYVQQTGLFAGVVSRIMYASKGKTWFVPFAVMLCAGVCAALGGAEVSPLLTSPIAFAVATYAGMNPLLAVLCVYCGNSLLGIGFWTSGGSSVRQLAADSLGEGASFISSYESLLFLAVFFLIVFIVAYFILKGNKLDKEKVSSYLAHRPEPLTKDQKFALWVVLGVVLLTMIPTLFQTLIYPNPVTAWMSTHLALKQNCLIGILVFHIAKVGDTKEIFKEKIPWNSFVMIGGCCMIVNCANDLGIIDFLSHAMASSIPAFLIPAFVVLICALLSFVSNMFAIVPMFAPMAAALAAATGLNPATLVACMICGCNATGLSPVSMGGSLAQIGASDEQRTAIFKKQWLTAVIVMVAMVLVSLLGVWNLFDAIFY